MHSNKKLLFSAIFLLATFMAGPSGALEITDVVQPPPAPQCPQFDGYFDAPTGAIDCPDPHCGRLIKRLRTYAQLRDAKKILNQSAFDFYMTRHPEIWGLYPGYPYLLPYAWIAKATADLAVTGRDAYNSFRSLNLNAAELSNELKESVKRTVHMFIPSHQINSADLDWSIKQSVDRAYKVAWALRGPVSYREAQRSGLGWIAVSGEDDPPHRPVNVPSAFYPQYNMTVQVRGHSVKTRFIVASQHIKDDYPVDTNTVPPDRPLPLIIGDIILFIHGHSSRLEEATSLITPILNQGLNRGRPVTLLAFDLPSNGYSSMIEHQNIADWTQSNWNTGYPILQFIEDFIVEFVNGLEMQQPGISKQIVGVIGGSLGGNMTLRLGERRPAPPWLHNLVSWSPASSWDSWARATLAPTFDPGRYMDITKHEAVRGTRDNMRLSESDGSRHDFFYKSIIILKVGFMGQSDHWYSPNWPCSQNAVEGALRSVEEIYNKTFRRWHWRVAHEQLIFSHWDSNNTDSSVDPDPQRNPAAGPARYSLINSRLLLATGTDDNFFPEKLYDNTRLLSIYMMPKVDGTTLFLKDTGHSIHAERPIFLANHIVQFLYKSPPPPFPFFLIPGSNF